MYNFRQVTFCCQVGVMEQFKKEKWMRIFTPMKIFQIQHHSLSRWLLVCLRLCLCPPPSLSCFAQILFSDPIDYFFPISCINYLKLLSFWFLFQDMHPGPSNQSGVGFISGIICKSKVLKFERMLFRATRGNMFFNQATADDQIMDPLSNEMVTSTYLLIVFF